MTREEDDVFERGIIENVRAHGCQVNYVFDPAGDQPAFAYSIGFPETVDQAEVIVFGLSQELMHAIINELLRRCRDGLVLEDELEIEGLLKGHVCVALAVPPRNITREHFNSAMWFSRHVTGEEMDAAFQIVWPGARDGLFPWDDDCSDEVRALQPSLAHDGSDA